VLFAASEHTLQSNMIAGRRGNLRQRLRRFNMAMRYLLRVTKLRRNAMK
jgi:hypothetical protein